MTEQPEPSRDGVRFDAPESPIADALARRPASGVGLCLSGGGYRAMLYHLGAVWRLSDAGLLPTLTRIGAVSAGSILAGVLGLAWPRLTFADGVATNFRAEVAEPVLGLAARTLDVPAVLLGLLTGGAARRMAAAYDRHLFAGATLRDLPDPDAPAGDPAAGPEILFLATDLHNGVLCEFSRRQIRNYLAYEVAHPGLPVAEAVAASSAFPPFLSPARLDLPTGRRVLLTDGGVYDNLGLEPVLKYVETIFVSDGGGPYEIKEHPRTDWLFGTERLVLTLIDKVGDLRRRQVVGGLVSKRRRGALWTMGTDPTRYARPAATLPVSHPETLALATSPTRLARVPEPLRNQLVNWGYASVDSALRTHHDPGLPEPPGFPLPGGVGGTAGAARSADGAGPAT